MTRGFYAASAAMMSDMERFETVANNLANVNTHGYKRHQTLHHDFRQGFVSRVQNMRQQLTVDAQGQPARELVNARNVAIGELGTGTMVTASWTHFDNGSLQETEAPFDLALKGDGFFTLEGPDGELRYTCNGHFQLDADGTLVSSDGWKVLGESGPIQLDGVHKPSVDAAGRVMADGQVLDSLRLVRFEQPQRLANEGANRYAATPGMTALEHRAEVAQGYLEQSNVDVASEMVQMISALRSYQISQKALQSEDEMNGRLINEVGRASA